MKLNRVLSMLAAGGAAIALTGCGTGTGTGPAPAEPPSAAVPAPAPAIEVSAEHNPADISFVQGMIPHHSQAIDMAELADQQAGSPQVKELAAKIEQAQDPEIEQMRNMLKAWGAPESGGTGGMSGMGHGSGSTAGMMSDQQMGQLEQAKGPDFDRLFLRMMIEHHKGAIAMSQTEGSQGQNPQAKALAEKIIKDQRAEISTMENLLKTV